MKAKQQLLLNEAVIRKLLTINLVYLSFYVIFFQAKLSRKKWDANKVNLVKEHAQREKKQQVLQVED